MRCARSAVWAMTLLTMTRGFSQDKPAKVSIADAIKSREWTKLSTAYFDEALDFEVRLIGFEKVTKGDLYEAFRREYKDEGDLWDRAIIQGQFRALRGGQRDGLGRWWRDGRRGPRCSARGEGAECEGPAWIEPGTRCGVTERGAERPGRPCRIDEPGVVAETTADSVSAGCGGRDRMARSLRRSSTRGSCWRIGIRAWSQRAAREEGTGHSQRSPTRTPGTRRNGR